MKKTFPKSSTAEILEFINENIKKHKLKKNEDYRASLMTEETLVLITEHASGDEITVGISYIDGVLRIRMIAAGEPFDLLEAAGSDPMRAALMQSFADDIRVKNHKGTNIVTITAYKSRYLLLFRLVGSGILGLLLSLLLKTVLPANVSTWIATEIMATGQTLFMNCLNMLIPPLVFFSIASAISGFGNTSQLGRVGGKIIVIYMMTTLCATIFGFILVELFKPYKVGSVSLTGAVFDSAEGISFKESFIKIIPENFVKSFLEADTVQIIFLAVFLGIAVTVVGSKAKPVQDFISAGNEVFLKMTNILVGFMPFLIFCIVSEKILSGGVGKGGMGMPIIAGVGVYLLAIMVMIVFYHVLLRVLGRLKPLKFKKNTCPTYFR